MMPATGRPKQSDGWVDDRGQMSEVRPPATRGRHLPPEKMTESMADDRWQMTEDR